MPAQSRTHRSTILVPASHVTYSNLVTALSFALDLTEGAYPGHAVRTCILGMRIGAELGLDEDLLDSLYYALLLKDVGCSSNSSRLHQIVGDDEIQARRPGTVPGWSRLEWNQVRYLLRGGPSRKSGMPPLKAPDSVVVNGIESAEQLIRLRCEKGAKVIRDLGLGSLTADAVYRLEEHWDGSGSPDRRTGGEIPLLASIVSVAQTLEVFERLHGVESALDVIQRRSQLWFDPEIVKVAVIVNGRGALWAGSADDEMRETVAMLQPAQKRVQADSHMVDTICAAFAGLVDAKSPYTYKHSSRVAEVAQQIGRCLNLSGRDITILGRAGLLHDIGKLAVPNSILDKRGKLTPEEDAQVKRHPYYTLEILRRISGFAEIAEIASSHHERLDGSGYFRGYKAEELCLKARILTVADMFDALSRERPYRERLSLDQTLNILKKETPHALDSACVEALASFAAGYRTVA